MAWEEDSCICLNMQLIAILSRIGVEMVFVCGWNDASGWEVTGLDWKSGATRHRSILGKNNRANGAYAIIQYLANGDLLFNSVAGPIRVKY